MSASLKVTNPIYGKDPSDFNRNPTNRQQEGGGVKPSHRPAESMSDQELKKAFDKAQKDVERALSGMEKAQKNLRRKDNQANKKALEDAEATLEQARTKLAIFTID